MTLPEILDENASLRQELRSMRYQERRYIARIKELGARAARADKLEAELKYIFDLMGGYLGSDLVPLPKERDVDHEDLWLSLDEAGFGKIVISPEFMRLRIIDALGDAAPSLEEGEDENRGFD